MKFTIENFKTRIIRPAERMVDTEKILRLLGDLGVRVLNTRFCSYSSADGLTFKIIISTKSHLYEDENEILAVRFCTTNRNCSDYDYNIFEVIFEDNLKEFVDKAKVSRYEAILLLKRINSIVFEVLTDIQEYDDNIEIE